MSFQSVPKSRYDKIPNSGCHLPSKLYSDAEDKDFNKPEETR